MHVDDLEVSSAAFVAVLLCKKPHNSHSGRRALFAGHNLTSVLESASLHLPAYVTAFMMGISRTENRWEVNLAGSASVVLSARMRFMQLHSARSSHPARAAALSHQGVKLTLADGHCQQHQVSTSG